MLISKLSVNRLTYLLSGWAATSKQIQEHKPTPAQIYARKHNIMQHKFLMNCYKMLQVQETESSDKITDNYIILKRQYSNRHYYIPNKKEYLLRLDEAYAKIMEVHPEYNYLQLNKQTGLTTKQEIVHFELQSIRKQVYINLLNSYDTALIILLVFFMFDVIYEERDRKDKKKPVTLMEEIPILRAIGERVSQIGSYFRLDKPFVIKPGMQKFLNQNKIDRESSTILKNSVSLQAMLANKKKQKSQSQSK